MRDDKSFELIVIFICIIFGILMSVISTQKNYIQNLEEKLNIYERSYEEFCLEDSLRQN